MGGLAWVVDGWWRGAVLTQVNTAQMPVLRSRDTCH
jgi:hypothetical protein